MEGGLSGLCLAHALLKEQVPVEVFERDPTPDARGQGYRLTIDQAGNAALKACLPARNYEFIRATAGEAGKTGAFVFMNQHAHELHRFTFDLEAGERRGDITGQVDRKTLRLALLAGLSGRVHFGKVFAGYREQPERVAALFEDGSSAEADILIGADGTNSRVRRQRMPEAEPRDIGICAIFGRTLMDGLDLPVLGRMLTDGGLLALGPRGRLFFCTAMRFRESPATVAKRLGIEGATWRGDDYFMWAVGFRKHFIDDANPGELDTRALHEIAGRAMNGFHEDYRVLVRRADPNDTVLVPIRAAPSYKALAPGRVTLLGDAMHTMPPFGAHGANTALRGAHMLTTKLADGRTSFSIPEVIGAYESETQAYSRPIIRNAMRMMTMSTADFPFKQVIFRSVLRAAAALAR